MDYAAGQTRFVWHLVLSVLASVAAADLLAVEQQSNSQISDGTAFHSFMCVSGLCMYCARSLPNPTVLITLSLHLFSSLLPFPSFLLPTFPPAAQNITRVWPIGHPCQVATKLTSILSLLPSPISPLHFPFSLLPSSF